MSDLGEFIVVRLDKEAGITSHDAVDRLRRVVGTRRVGHAGTLDPFATGLLLLAWGRATRLLPFLSGLDKGYEGTILFGATTDTYDLTGRTVAVSEAPLDPAALEAALAGFRGSIEQRAPAVSAIKQGGEPLHRKVRRGEAVEPPVRRVTVHEFEVSDVDPATRRARFRVRCSSGTYVRSLAHDLGQALGMGAALETLRRTSIGPHGVAGAIPTAGLLDRPVGSIPEWNERLRAAGLTAHQALSFLPALVLDAAEAEAVSHGRVPEGLRERAAAAAPAPGAGAYLLEDAAGAFLGVAAPSADGARLELPLVWASAGGAVEAAR